MSTDVFTQHKICRWTDFLGSAILECSVGYSSLRTESLQSQSREIRKMKKDGHNSFLR